MAIIGASQSDNLVLYLGHSLGESVYSIAVLAIYIQEY